MLSAWKMISIPHYVVIDHGYMNIVVTCFHYRASVDTWTDSPFRYFDGFIPSAIGSGGIGCRRQY